MINTRCIRTVHWAPANREKGAVFVYQRPSSEAGRHGTVVARQSLPVITFSTAYHWRRLHVSKKLLIVSALALSAFAAGCATETNTNTATSNIANTNTTTNTSDATTTAETRTAPDDSEVVT